MAEQTFLSPLLSDAREMLFDVRRERRDLELNRYKRNDRMQRQGLLPADTDIEMDALASAEAASSIPADTTGMRYNEIPNVYQGADQHSMQGQLTPQQQAELETQRERHGAILDSLAYLTGNTSRRSAYEKAVGSTMSSRKDRDADRQDYIDRAIGQLIFKYSPETSVDLKQILVASGITDVDDIKRAHEIFEQFKPEAAPVLASDYLGGDAFAQARPTVSEIIAANPKMSFEEAQAISQMVPMPDKGPQLGTDAAEAMYIAESNWDNATDDQRQLLGGDKDAFVQQRAAEIMLAQKQKPNAVGPQSKAAELIEVTQVKDMLKASQIDVSAAEADRQKATLSLQLINEGIIQTGPTAPIRMTIKRWAHDMFSGSGDPTQQQLMAGLELGAYDFFDVFSKLSGARNISLTKGAVSDREMGVFMSMAPQLIKTPQGNRILLEIIQNSAAREIDLSTVSEEFRKLHGHTVESAKLWMSFVRDHPLMQKWSSDAEGFGGIIPREMWTQFEGLIRGSNVSGLADPGGYNITENVITSEKEGWEFLTNFNDTEKPIFVPGEDGADGSWWIVRNGKAIEVTLKQ
jgi:hypothetical protein